MNPYGLIEKPKICLPYCAAVIFEMEEKMLNKEKINQIPKEAGVYWFSFENKIVYVGSSKNLSKRMYYYNYYIKKGHNNNQQIDLVNYLKETKTPLGYIEWVIKFSYFL